MERKTLKTWNSTAKNVAYILKLCFVAEPLYILLIVIDAIRGSLSVFFEHTLGVAYILKAAEDHYPFFRVVGFVVFLVIFIVVGMLFNSFVQQYYAAKVSPRMYKKIKSVIYEKARSVDLSAYENSSFYDSYMICISQIDSQISKSISLLQSFASNIVTAFLTGVFFIAVDKEVIIFVVLSCAIRLWSGDFLGKLNYKIKIENKKNERQREYIKRVFYLDTYAKDVRLYPLVKDMLLNEFADACEKCEAVERKYVRKKFFLSLLYSYFSTDFISYVLFVCYLIYRVVISGTLTIGTFVVLFTSFSTLRTSLLLFTDLYTEAVENGLFIQRIREFLNEENKIKESENAKVYDKFSELRMEEVSFSYDKEHLVIDGFSIRIKKGEKIAIVGYNGAGKSTLVKMLLRLYDPTKGRVLVNGNPIEIYYMDLYRKSIGTVFQDYTIFPMTISENVKMDIVDEKDYLNIDNSLRASGLGEVVGGLQNGRNSIMTKEFSDDGVVLSGGQMQRVAIARTQFLNPELIIMDEPSSALDPNSEYKLNQILLRLSKSKTVVYISHRLSTVKIADRIILMNKGRIVEMGSHEELMKAHGIYYGMYIKQSSLYAED